MPTAKLESIYRYPVKGLSPDRLESVGLTPGATLPFDRAWAIENGPSGFDSQHPAYLPKIKFLMLMKNERLAALETRFDEASCTLEVFRHGKRVAGGRLDDPLGCRLLEQFFAAYMDEELRGAPRILKSDGHSFSDVSSKVVSIASLSSLREVERVAGRPVHPLRFRANLYVDGWLPWQEFMLVGETLRIGKSATVKVVSRIVRCAATNVDPESGARDMQIPRLIDGAFGHSDFGVYAEVTGQGTIRPGDTITAA